MKYRVDSATFDVCIKLQTDLNRQAHNVYYKPLLIHEEFIFPITVKDSQS